MELDRKTHQDLSYHTPGVRENRTASLHDVTILTQMRGQRIKIMLKIIMMLLGAHKENQNDFN